jgi:heme oxygenase
LFSRFDLSRPDDYGRFLGLQAAAHLPIEGALDRAGVEALVPDWPARRRAGLLEADLAELGVAGPEPVEPPRFETGAALLGGLYVLEGSRLGAAVLRRRLAPGAPSRFLGAVTPDGAWARLLALLDGQLDRDGELAAAVQAARAVFRCFERAGSRDLETLLA